MKILFVFLYKTAVAVLALLVASTAFAAPQSGFYDGKFFLQLEDGEAAYYTLDGSLASKKNKNCFDYALDYDEEGNTTSTKKFCTHTHPYGGGVLIDDQSSTATDSYAAITTTSEKISNNYPIKPSLFNESIRIANKFIAVINQAYAHMVRFFHFLGYLFTGDLEPGARDVPGLPFLKFIPGKLPKGTVFRAANALAEPLATRVFFFTDSLQTELPIINITVPPDELFSYGKGVFVYGKNKPNWTDKRKIDAFVTMISKDKQHVFEQQMQLKVHGNASRKNAIKSMRLYPSKSGIQFDVFEEGGFLGFQRINLRNSGQDYDKTYLADATLHTVFRQLNFGVQRYKPYLVFINGQYYGILNARDRRDHHYIQTRFDLPTTDVDHIKRNKRVKRGDAEHWDATLTTLAELSPSTKAFSRYFTSRFDVESFYDYVAAQVFIANIDWPQNNIAYWRAKNTDAEHPFMDGKWRWLFYDADLYADWQKGKQATRHESLQRLMNYKQEEALSEQNLFGYALRNKDIQEAFVARFADLLNSTFLYVNIANTMDSFAHVIANEMERHIQRWEKPQDIHTWQTEMANMLAFFKERKKHQFEHLRSVFDLNDMYSLELNINNGSLGTVQLNSIEISTKTNELAGFALPWRGQYFQDMPLSLTAKPSSGHIFSHWSITGEYEGDITSRKIEIYPKENLAVTAVFEPVGKLEGKK